MTRGVFIAFEGIDGAGTTTQAAALARQLQARGIDVHLTAEPSTRPLGVQLRRALRREIEMAPDTMALTFAADRSDHWHGEIAPALANGRWVICDRYLLSSFAYQSLNAPLEWIVTLNGFVGRPEVTFYLRVDPDTAAARRASREGPAETFENEQFQRRVAARYDEVVHRDDVGPVVTLNGAGTREEVEAALWAEVEEFLRRTEGTG